MTLPAEEPVTVTPQLEEDSVHCEAENDTLPEPLCVHETVPVGDRPVTEAVHEELELMANDDGVQDTPVAVGAEPDRL